MKLKAIPRRFKTPWRDK